MAYVSIGRLKRALDALKDFHAFFGISYLSMKKGGVTRTTPTKWGSAQENELLKTYYSPPGAPPGKPYFSPFKTTGAGTGYWRNEKYSGGTLQRARTTDRPRAALIHPSESEWAFAADYTEKLKEVLPEAGGKKRRVPVFDLAAWLFRDKDLPASLDEVVKHFRQEFKLSNDKDFNALFDADKAQESEGEFFFSEPVSSAELINLIGGIPEGAALGGRSEDDVIKALEKHVREESLLWLPAGFVRDFYSALKAQRFVILAGRPGTGKTAFARAYAAALESVFPEAAAEIIISIGQDFGDADTIGYERLAGGIAPTELTRSLFFSGRPKDCYVVVLDEMNLAEVDYYLARLLPAIESGAPVELPGLPERHELPPDTYFVGTINSYVEESTRLPLSGPVKRRANLIEMPNSLDDILRRDARSEFEELLRRLLQQTLHQVTERQTRGLGSVTDTFRKASLESAVKSDAALWKSKVSQLLWDICKACGADRRSSLTLGVLQDVLDYIAMANDSTPLVSLDKQIAQKLSVQLAGPSSIAKAILELLEKARSTDCEFERGRQALNDLIASADPTSGLLIARY